MARLRCSCYIYTVFDTGWPEDDHTLLKNYALFIGPVHVNINRVVLKVIKCLLVVFCTAKKCITSKVKLTISVHRVSRLRMGGALSPLHPYTFITWTGTISL